MFARMHIAYRSFVDVNVCTHVSHVAVFHAHALEVTEWICAAHAASILRNCRWQCHADGRDDELLDRHAEVRHACRRLFRLAAQFQFMSAQFQSPPFQSHSVVQVFIVIHRASFVTARIHHVGSSRILWVWRVSCKVDQN